MRIDPMSTILPTEEMLLKSDECKIRTAENQRIRSLRWIYDSWLSTHGEITAANWIDKEGKIVSMIKNFGARADYIVVGQPEEHAERAESEALHTALFKSNRPVLMMPRKVRSQFGKCIVIAWRDDKFTRRALFASIRVASRAEQIHILIGRRRKGKSPRLPEILFEHGINATARELALRDGAFGAQLLATAHEVKVDLLVMGAFVHSTWHNMLFGGVTKHILSHADIPVLLHH